MARTFAAMFVLGVFAVLALVGTAWAGDIEGKIKSVEGSVVTLEDGTKLSIPAGARIDRMALKPGASVKASYQEQGADKVLTAIQVMPSN